MIYPKYIVKPTISSRYKPLTEHLSEIEEFKPLCVDEYTPGDTRQRRHYIDNLKNGLPYKCILFRVSAGNNLGTHNFIWRVPMNTIQKEDVLTKNNDVIQGITKDLPTYHTRFMKRNFLQKVTLLCDVKPMEARCIYKDLTGDNSAPETSNEKIIDEKVKQAFELQDPDVILDLREHNEGQPTKYSVFFDHAKTYIENVVETAVDDRRHDTIQHLATAMSVRDLLNQVKGTCPEGTPIPSEQWLRLQFAPKNHSSINSLQYTGNLHVKYQVQSRQLRKSHIDLHYASAIFRYMKDFAVKFRDNAVMVCMDDKHHCKVGEPGHPVAAVDRGKRVIVGQDSVFAVSDHDFTKFSIVPSVTMLIDIPETMDGSFYRGQVNVGVKDLVLEPSNPIRHITELSQILNNEDAAKYKKPIMCIYSDGGPDHRLTYMSVQLAILCLFLKGNYDYIVAARTPPMSSWKNPPERIMSVLNLALQAVGLMRKETSEECERKLRSANSLKQLRELADKYPDIHEEMVDSTQPVKILLTQLFQRLQLKDEPFKCFTAASDREMKEFWGALDRFGEPLDFNEMHQKELKQAVKDRSKWTRFGQSFQHFWNTAAQPGAISSQSRNVV
ncbi:uncharacterized protein LOC117340399 [Pecten maximus]|uniref:uncharacterized protein LOC117340399 n=1 Tax=Pecten maximus TaxID=6579 RepID=UPI00145857CB|nr:uncharacterized protein LOC117340399 [Pecten maximus]